MRLHEYKNVPLSIGAVVSSGKATIQELQTIYGLKDVYDMLEVISVDAANRAILAKKDD